MSLINNNQPQINPHMKLAPQNKGVIQPPAVYSYSLAEDLKRGEIEYKQLIGSLDKKQHALFEERHPNLKSNIASIIKYTIAIATLCCGYRYRHSIPFLKSFCKKPQNTPPKFLEEIQRIWHNITTKK